MEWNVDSDEDNYVLNDHGERSIVTGDGETANLFSETQTISGGLSFDSSFLEAYDRNINNVDATGVANQITPSYHEDDIPYTETKTRGEVGNGDDFQGTQQSMHDNFAKSLSDYTHAMQEGTQDYLLDTQNNTQGIPSGAYSGRDSGRDNSGRDNSGRDNSGRDNSGRDNSGRDSGNNRYDNSGSDEGTRTSELFNTTTNFGMSPRLFHASYSYTHRYISYEWRVTVVTE
jgi:hypothetical protein